MERRAFFKLAGLSAASLAAGGALAACEGGPLPENPLTVASENESTAREASVVGQPAISFGTRVDVLVIGSGIAGLSAAMAPVEAGRSVLVADKLDLLGGESFDSNGVMYVSGSAVQQQASGQMAPDEAWDARRQRLVAAGIEDTSLAKTAYEAAGQWVDHLADIYGAQFMGPEAYAQEATGEPFVLPRNGLGDMESVMVPLRDGLADKGAAFATDQRATAFILGEDGTVCGVRFCSVEGAAVIDVRARRVVVATGGFASSQPLVHRHLPAQERIGCATSASMGEGLALCASILGQLDGMDRPGQLIGDLPQVAAWGLFGATVVVDPQGRRFAREDDGAAVAAACVSAERGFWWTIFGKQLGNGSQSRSMAAITSKNANRLVGPCDTLDDLASAMGVPPDILKATFVRYDAAVGGGKDEEFGRTLFLQKLEAPYYALKQFPVRFASRGGARVDAGGRLLTAAGTVVAHVHCCGAVTAGGVEGLASCGAFGMLTGQAVVASLDEEDA